MRVSVRKLLKDVLVLTDRHPEPYTYALLIEAASKVQEFSFETVPELRTVNIVDPASELIAAMEQGEPIAKTRRNFIVFFQAIWNQVNRAAKKLPKSDAKEFLKTSTKLFWDTVTEEDKKAQAHSEGRRYGAFWIPFLIGATALGGIFAYSSGKSTKEYVEAKERETSPIIYASVGAAAVLGLMIVMKR